MERSAGPTLILQAVLGGESLSPTRLDALLRQVNWPALLSLAESRLQVPALHALVAQHGRINDLPVAVARKLGDAAANNAARNQYLLASLRNVTGALHEHGIASTLLKGAALLVSDSDYAQVRYLDDIDLLIEERRHGDAVGVMRRLGFTPMPEPVEFQPGKFAGRRGPPPREVHHESAHVDSHGLVVELHSRLPFGWEGQVLDRAVGAGRLAPGALSPSVEDQLGILAAHVLGHHGGDPRFLVRHLADVRTLLARGVDPNLAARRFDVPGARPVERSLELLKAARRAAETPSRVFMSAPERAVRPRTSAARWFGAFRYGLGTWWTNAGIAGVRLVFPSREFMERRYALPSGSILVWPLYLMRPLLAVGRLLRRQSG